MVLHQCRARCNKRKITLPPTIFFFTIVLIGGGTWRLAKRNGEQGDEARYCTLLGSRQGRSPLQTDGLTTTLRFFRSVGPSLLRPASRCQALDCGSDNPSGV